MERLLKRDIPRAAVHPSLRGDVENESHYLRTFSHKKLGLEVWPVPVPLEQKNPSRV